MIACQDVGELRQANTEVQLSVGAIAWKKHVIFSLYISTLPMASLEFWASHSSIDIDTRRVWPISNALLPRFVETQSLFVLRTFSKCVNITSEVLGNLGQATGSTKHHGWVGDPRVNVQGSKGMTKPYQVKQVLAAIEKLEAENGS